MIDQTTLTQTRLTTDLARFNVTDDAIRKLSALYAPLVIEGLTDKEGYAAVRKGRGVVRALRMSVEAMRKTLKADYLAGGRAVDGEATRITELLRAVEDPLHEKEKVIDAERAAIAAEEARVLQENLDAERAAVVAEEARVQQEKLDIERAELERVRRVEDARIHAERRRLDAEREKLDAQRQAHAAALAKDEDKRLATEAVLREEKVRMAKQQAALQSAQNKVAAEQRASVEAREREQAQKEAAKAAAERECLRIEQEERDAQAAAVRASKVEAQRLAALPSAEKSRKFAAAIRAIPVPAVPTFEVKIQQAVDTACDVIKEIADEVER